MTTTWMTESDKEQLVRHIQQEWKTGSKTTADVLHAKMSIEGMEAQTKAAFAEERAAIAGEIAANASVKNAKYMLWSVIAAAVSAIASLGSTLISVIGHH